MAAAGGAAAAAAAAQIEAIKASGAIVQVKPDVFLTLVARVEEPLVVTSYGGFLSKRHTYLSAYKGLVIACKSSAPLVLPANAEMMPAGKIWLPSN